MNEEIISIVERAIEEIRALDDLKKLELLRIRMLGKKGALTQTLRSMRQLPPDDRPAFGQLVNRARERLEAALEARAALIERLMKNARLKDESLDVTLPTKHKGIGSVHPTTLILNEMVEIFTGMGFTVVEGPEVEWDHYNFELLNLPKHHPSRDAQDTFYVDENIVLRTHTSPAQARVMTTAKPPLRIICPGRCYRADEADSTHSPVFHQMEGLAIDEGISMGDLKGTLDTFARKLFGEGVTTRFRPSFFPFTEPSAEVDLTCAACMGAGCRMCNGTGWIEVLGSGMVNPKVLGMCGIDSKKYTGFAFGVGLDRLAVIKYSVPDMRYLFENDLRFLTHFR
jgi:phenylalanyl-tRNA synthetase alpha chain